MVIFFLLLFFFILINTVRNYINLYNNILMTFLHQLLIIFNILIYNYYVDPSENYKLANITFIITMSIGLFCLMLVPIDSYIISDIQELKIEEAKYSYSLKRIYFVRIYIYNLTYCSSIYNLINSCVLFNSFFLLLWK